MTIRDNDAVIFFNFRIDRPRELTRAFVLKDFENSHDTSFDPFNIEYEKTHIQKSSETKPFKRKKTLTNLFFVTMTQYEENLPVQIAFPPQEIQNPLGKVFSDLGLRQLRITETEKEKFVTYYMNGGKEIQFKGEDRIIIPSKGVKSYDEAPEMSAREITREMLKQIDKNIYDVIICNFANADMVGHTGNIQAAIQSIKTLDNCLKEIVQEVGKRGGMVIITADHGNAEEMINNQTGEIDTKHSFYPVPFIVISKEFLGRDDLLPRGILSDVAPTMLDLMGLEIPKTMTGQVLFKPQRSPTQGG
jgi:2,3-bisphosphoglycerate-independent phosphoglycerate mutase